LVVKGECEGFDEPKDASFNTFAFAYFHVCESDFIEGLEGA
jgi:hypothetical protein